MSDLLATLCHALREPADALLDPTKRVYGPFLACSGVIAAALLAVRGVRLGRIAPTLLSPRIWFHRSAIADYQLIAVKALLRVVFFGSYGLSTVAVAAITAGWLRRHAGLPALTLSPVLVGGIYTVVAFVVEDWSRFALHRAMHRIPFLWELHKVHHSAEVLTPFTLYRTHPVESALNGIRSAAAVGLVTGTCAWLFGPGLAAWQILGVDAIGFVWTLFGANLRHSHVWVSYGRWLEHLAVSPAQHQIHHSQDPRHYDRNFGTILAVWDWLGGSLYVTTERERLRFGIDKKSPNPQHSIGSLVVAPAVAALRGLLSGIARVARSRHALRAVVIVVLGALLCTGCASKRLDRPTSRSASTICCSRSARPRSPRKCVWTSQRRATPWTRFPPRTLRTRWPMIGLRSHGSMTRSRR
jgi:sterol desaturase/sphingolipid hydroxylase (fatty acid hydroxylase superfamily)